MIFEPSDFIRSEHTAVEGIADAVFLNYLFYILYNYNEIVKLLPFAIDHDHMPTP